MADTRREFHDAAPGDIVYLGEEEIVWSTMDEGALEPGWLEGGLQGLAVLVTGKPWRLYGSRVVLPGLTRRGPVMLEYAEVDWRRGITWGATRE